MLESMEDLVEEAKSGPVCRAVVPGAAGREVLGSLRRAEEEGILRPYLVGGAERIEELAREVGLKTSDERIIPADDDGEICRKAVKLLADDEADIMMKGLVSTSTLMKEVLKGEHNLRRDKLISHLVLAQVPALDRLIFISDGGMNIKPTLEEKAAIIQNAIDAARRLGWREPRVAVMAAVEKPREAMPETIDAAVLSKMGDRGQISGGIVEGPYALDNALSSEAADIKGLEGPVAGQADILITPEIAAGNLLGKSVIHLAGGEFAALLGGTRKPIVVTSRSDSARVRFISLAAAVVMSGG